MSDRSLLERLRNSRLEAERRSSIDVSEAKESVAHNLHRIFNSRQGHALTVPDYGLPDLTDFMREYPVSVNAMEKAIQQAIERYEPRLRSVRVRFRDSDTTRLLLTFEIKARLVLQGEAAAVSFAARIESEGRLRVES